MRRSLAAIAIVFFTLTLAFDSFALGGQWRWYKDRPALLLIVLLPFAVSVPAAWLADRTSQRVREWAMILFFGLFAAAFTLMLLLLCYLVYLMPSLVREPLFLLVSATIALLTVLFGASTVREIRSRRSLAPPQTKS